MAFETPQVETVFHALVLILDLNQELVSATKLSLQYTQTPFVSHQILIKNSKCQTVPLWKMAFLMADKDRHPKWF